ncbi:MAG TPA: hypothetical protein VFF09_00510 [archaeon]|nr:hypothetical protein [archaeon]
MKTKAEKPVKFCPKCGSTNVKPIYFMESVDNRVQCISCGTIELPFEGDEKFRKNFLGGLKNGKKA